MGKVEPIRPLEQTSSTLREHLAALIEQRDKAKKTREAAMASLVPARQKQRETKARFDSAQAALAAAMERYRPQTSDAAPVRSEPPLRHMGGQSWDFRNAEPNEPNSPASVPEIHQPLRVLLNAETEAMDADDEAGIAVGRLEAVIDEANRVISKAEAAIRKTASAIFAPALSRKQAEVEAAEERYVNSRVELWAMCQEGSGPEVDAANSFLRKHVELPYGSGAISYGHVNWSNHPVASRWKEAFERLLTDPNTQLPE